MEFLEDLGTYNFLFKFMILGISDTGKTFLTERIKLFNNFSEYIKKVGAITPTIGVDFKILNINYKNQLFKIQFWDTSGSERFKDTVAGFMRGCKAFLLCYDAFNRDSFNHIIKQYKELKNYYKKAIYVLVRNKYDKKIDEDNIHNDIVSDEEALEFAEENNIIFSHISSVIKNETGIKRLFELILDKILSLENNIIKSENNI